MKSLLIILVVILFSNCSCLSHKNMDDIKKIDVAKLEGLSNKYKDKSEKNLEVAFEASGEGGYYIYETTKNNTTTTSVSKKDFKIIEISKSINKLKDNTTEVFTYSADGILKKYIKSHNPTKIEGTSIGEIRIDHYVETIEKFNNIGSIESRKNYNEIFRISLQDIITIAKENHYKI